VTLHWHSPVYQSGVDVCYGDTAQTVCNFEQTVNAPYLYSESPVRALGCKNRLAPFPGWMSYKATKPGLVSVLYLSML